MEAESPSRHSLMLFRQTRAGGSALGCWFRMEAPLYQVFAAVAHSHHGRSVGANCQAYSVWRAADGSGLPLPAVHSLEWGARLAGESLLWDGSSRSGFEQVEEHLGRGDAIQIFVFNGDSDCVAHYLVLPLPPVVAWLT